MKEKVKELLQQLEASMLVPLGPFTSVKDHNRAVSKTIELYVRLRCLGDEGYAALDELLTHPNPMLRGDAAYWTYPRHPEKSIAILQEIYDNTLVGFNSGKYDAGLALRMIARGHYFNPIDEPKAKARYDKAMAKLAAEGKK